MRTIVIAAAVALACGCASVLDVGAADVDAIERGAVAHAPTVWPQLAAADEDVLHSAEVDTDELKPSDEARDHVVIDDKRKSKAHRVGLRLGFQTYVSESELDAGDVSPLPLFGLNYKYVPGGAKLAYEFGFEYAQSGLAEYSGNVEADTSLNVWKGAILYSLTRGGLATSTYLSGGLMVVDETAEYRNASDGTSLETYRNVNAAVSLGIGQTVARGSLDFRYDITLPLASESGASYHYLTVGYSF